MVVDMRLSCSPVRGQGKKRPLVIKFSRAIPVIAVHIDIQPEILVGKSEAQVFE